MLCLSMKSCTNIGMNDPRFLFVLDMMVLNLLDEGRTSYVECVYCRDFSGFMQYLLFIHSIYIIKHCLFILPWQVVRIGNVWKSLLNLAS